MISREDDDDAGFEPLGQAARRVVEDLDWRRLLDCAHGRTQVRRKTIMGGRQMFKQQCVDCGRGVGTAVAFAKVEDKSVEWDEVAESALERAWDDRNKWLSEQTDNRIASLSVEQEEWWAKYNAYLLSPIWLARRSAVMARDRGVCQACLERQAGEVHHLTYAHAFNEPLFDLVAVCKACHDRLTHLDRCARDGYRYKEPITEW